MLDLEEIKERLAAATPGERKYEQSSLDSTFFVSALVGPGWEVLARFGIRRETDAVFDAHAPADIKALLEEVERLRATLPIGARAVCRTCGMPIVFVGPHWDHEGVYKPRHAPVPVK